MLVYCAQFSTRFMWIMDSQYAKSAPDHIMYKQFTAFDGWSHSSTHYGTIKIEGTEPLKQIDTKRRGHNSTWMVSVGVDK